MEYSKQHNRAETILAGTWQDTLACGLPFEQYLFLGSRQKKKKNPFADVSVSATVS